MEAIQPKVMEHLYNFYKENPYTRLLELHVDQVACGSVVLSMQVTKEHTNFYGIAHGGAVMSLADTAMGATCLSCNKKVVTQAMTTNFMTAAPVGVTLLAEGKILHNGRKTMVCEVEIKDQKGIFYGKSTGTFFVIGHCVEETPSE